MLFVADFDVFVVALDVFVVALVFVALFFGQLYPVVKVGSSVNITPRRNIRC